MQALGDSRDIHSVVTIELCELIECGLFDWENDEDLKWDAYSDEQYERVCTKFVNRYFHREVSIVPFGLWRLEYVRKFNEVMPKYKLLYKALDGFDFMADKDEYGKYRTIDSEFPQTMLSGNSDYASSGHDHEFETITKGNQLDKFLQFARDYKDVDVMILDDMETLFSCMFTVNVNGW